MASGTAAIGSTRPARLEQPADEVEPGDGVLVQLPEGDDEQVAQRVPAERAVAGEPVLEDVAPGVPPLGVAAQRGQRHPQVARRQDPELLAQPPARAAVVGDRDDRGDLVGDEAQRGERRGQPVAAPERGDDRPAHSRPRSRCTTKVAMSASADRSRRERLGDGDRAVLAAGAADGEGRVAAPLAQVPRGDRLHEGDDAVEERARALLGQDVLGDRLVDAR